MTISPKQDDLFWADFIVYISYLPEHSRADQCSNPRFNLMKNKKSGFSLAELVVVVTVIGVLGAVGFRGLGSWEQEAQRANMDQDAKNVSSAALLYFKQNPTANLIFPSSLGSRVTLSDGVRVALIINPDYLPATHQFYNRMTLLGPTGVMTQYDTDTGQRR